jgi:hypothetical protein
MVREGNHYERLGKFALIKGQRYCRGIIEAAIRAGELFGRPYAAGRPSRALATSPYNLTLLVVTPSSTKA